MPGVEQPSPDARGVETVRTRFRRRTGWLVLAVVVGALAVSIGIAFVGPEPTQPEAPAAFAGPTPTNGPLDTIGPTAAPAPTTSSTPAPTGRRVLTAFQISGGGGAAGGAGCYPTVCQFFWEMDSWGFEPLSGQFVLTPTGSTAAGTWGTIGVCAPQCGYPHDLVLVIDMTTAPIAWEGEWFTPGSRPLSTLDLVGDLAGEAVDIDTFLPIETVWLHGRGDDAGLTAILRMWLELVDGDPRGVPRMSGWVFPTP